MRLIAVDEAGTSVNDAVTVVASVLFHSAEQIAALESHLDEVRSKHIPAEYREGFVFHAKTIWSGGKPPFEDKTAWPHLRRVEIIKDVLAARATLGFSVSYGYALKDPDATGNMVDYAHWRHMTAYTLSLCGCERYLRQHAAEGEVAAMLAEDHPTHGHDLEALHRDIVSPTTDFPIYPELIPMKHVAPTLIRQKKTGSPLLQYADACAFALRRFFSGKEDARPLLDALKGPLEFSTIRRPLHPHGGLMLSSHPPAGMSLGPILITQRN